MVDSCGVFLKKQWFIGTKQGKIQDIYDFDPKKLIGSGSYGTVIKATLKQTKIKRAIKIIPKSKVKNPERFKSEIDIMRKLDHPNIIKLYETFEDAKNLYLIMELCEGGELFDMIIERGHLNEEDARKIFHQIMQAIHYCHTNKICHRDLKPENFLLLTKEADSPIKVIDFGLSTIFKDKQAAGIKKKAVTMTTKAGTPYYISPEVLDGSYDEMCDIWSAGVILYVLLSGSPPFYGDTDEDILEAVKKGEYGFDVPEFEFVSGKAKDIIQNMITKPSKRFSAGQVLNHPWIKTQIVKSNLKLNINTLKNFQNAAKLKKAALTYIASQLSEKEINQLGNLFKKIDKNGDGVLTIEEIKSVLRENQEEFSAKEIENIMGSLDTDGNGTLNYTEFLAATIEKNLYLEKEKMLITFNMFDLDGSGKISASELKQILGSDPNFKNDPEVWDQMIKEVDKNGDGEIDYAEFVEMMEFSKA